MRFTKPSRKNRSSQDTHLSSPLPDSTRVQKTHQPAGAKLFSDHKHWSKGQSHKIAEDRQTTGLSEQEVRFYSDALSPSYHQMQGGLSRPGAIFTILLGMIGAFASLSLLLTEIEHRRNPTAGLSCSLNAVVDCSHSMDSWQGHLLFGWPNSVFGIIGFLALITLGGYLLIGRRLPHWAQLGLVIIFSLSSLLVCWFLYQSAIVLKSLCPYCMVVWAVVLAITWFWVASYLRYLSSPTRPLKNISRTIVSYWWLGILLTYLVIFLLLVMVFGIQAIF